MPATKRRCISSLPHLKAVPRSVPLSARICALFGGFMNQFGWAFFGFSLIFVWIFALDVLVSDLQFRGTLAPGQAVIERVQATSAKENRSRVYAHFFQFSHEGKSYQARSYATGLELPVGTQVPIEFKPEEPNLARITQAGFRAAPFGHLVLLVLLFPLAGLLLIGQGILRGRTISQLLAQGQLVQVPVSEQQDTGTSVKINGKIHPVYKLVFQYTVQGQHYQTELKTHEVERLLDEPLETLLYLPAKPQVAFPLDAIPGQFSIRDGGFVCLKPAKSGLLLLLPLFSALFITILVLGH